jgi:hypothetical protein
MTDGANLSPSEFVTWVGTLDAVEQRAWAIALATAFAQRRADEQNELGAAYRAYDHDAGTPVRSDSEFDFAFHLAVAIGETRPLRDHVSSGMPVPQYPVTINGWPVRDAPALVAELLGQPAPQQQTRGRAFRIAAEAQPAEQAERNAAWLVAFALKEWRERNGRKRAPSDIISEIISASITEAAKFFNVPENAISESNIRNVLKTRTVVVP